MRALLLLAVALVAGACSLARPTPEVRYFAIVLPGGRPASLGVPVHVGLITADQAYASTRMAHRTSPYQIDYDAWERWASPPRALVAGALRDALDTQGTGATVEITGEVRRMEAVGAGEATRGLLALALRATRAGTELVTRTYGEEEPAGGDAPDEIAAAISRALERIVVRFRDDLATALAAARPGLPPRTGTSN